MDNMRSDLSFSRAYSTLSLWLRHVRLYVRLEARLGVMGLASPQGLPYGTVPYLQGLIERKRTNSLPYRTCPPAAA